MRPKNDQKLSLAAAAIFFAFAAWDVIRGDYTLALFTALLGADALIYRKRSKEIASLKEDNARMCQQLARQNAPFN